MIDVIIDYGRARCEHDPDTPRRTTYLCAHGVFCEFPEHDDGSPPPPVAAFNIRRWAQHPRRRDARGATLLDVVLAGEVHTYRLAQAYVPLGPGGSRRGLCSFEVGVLLDPAAARDHGRWSVAALVQRLRAHRGRSR